MENFVIIDIGSNSVRMAILQIESDGSFKEINRVKNDTRLSEGMGNTKLLKEKSIKRTIKALKKFKSIYSKYENVSVHAIATAAVRQAKNNQKFLDEVKKELKFDLRILTGNEEAYYDYLGVVNNVQMRDFLLMDVGGGSVEIIHVRDSKAINYTSIPIGSVGLSEAYSLTDKINASDLFSAQSSVLEYLSRIPWLSKTKHYPVILIGGAARALARINLKKQKQQDPNDIQNFQLTRKQVNKTMEMFLKRNLKTRQKIYGLEYDRADVIVGGTLCLTTMLNLIDSKRVVFSEGGVREGLILEYINQKY
ncbi:exopolyphosphatase [Lactobacillus sp. S2-2]|uniref:Ppx/GppA family phosphatase n=1 Tax=Lactobacillus sp. S2-2 TaxID=2692917 RepID=UPI001F309441|nr:Ppx/GppA family phosphatase [Lactobacillus sp. S2-2]MCF6515844.1 exopolyphosphatase [Lactobacillus sp. S2-2]